MLSIVSTPSDRPAPTPPPELAARIVPILRDRDGHLTLVTMADGRVLKVFNIAWGQDAGEDYEHVTTNISPSIEGQVVDFFLTSEVANISIPAGGELLFVQAKRV
jgi:hypothetical protein